MLKLEINDNAKTSSKVVRSRFSSEGVGPHSQAELSKIKKGTAEKHKSVRNMKKLNTCSLGYAVISGVSDLSVIVHGRVTRCKLYAV